MEERRVSPAVVLCGRTTVVEWVILDVGLSMGCLVMGFRRGHGEYCSEAYVGVMGDKGVVGI